MLWHILLDFLGKVGLGHCFHAGENGAFPGRHQVFTWGPISCLPARALDGPRSDYRGGDSADYRCGTLAGKTKHVALVHNFVLFGFGFWFGVPASDLICSEIHKSVQLDKNWGNAPTGTFAP